MSALAFTVLLLVMLKIMMIIIIVILINDIGMLQILMRHFAPVHFNSKEPTMRWLLC